MSKSVTAMLVLAFLTASWLTAVKPAVADDGIRGNLSVTSPDSQTAYTGTMLVDLTIAWSVSLPIPWMHVKCSYGIDGGPTVIFTNESSVVFWTSSSIVFTYARSVLDISSLANGKHKLTIVAEGDYNFDNDFVFPLNYPFAPIYFYANVITPPDILVWSPQNKRYSVADIPLNFTIETPTSWIGYSLDRQNNETIGENTTLIGLSDGSHSLVVYAYDTVGNVGAQRVTFTIAVPPKIGVLSPLNQTYDESSVPLIFTVDKTVNWTGYSLDGKQNVTVIGNSTVTNMTNGLHSITVLANDTFGNIVASETVDFSVEVPVETPKPQPELFPMTLVVASIGAAVIVGLGLLVYFKKLRGETKQT
jgi:hypothetical protein